jgi:hypothetical protein
MDGAWMREIVRSAEISLCGQYRWWLERRWDDERPKCCFVMLNPSTADAATDDPTIRRCIYFADRWGFSSVRVLNVFAYRATDPRILLTVPDPVGGLRADFVLKAAPAVSEKIIIAWGAMAPRWRHDAALALLRPAPIFCLGKTKEGFPRHPLYVAASRPLERFQESRCHT